MKPVTVIGIGDDGCRSLSPAAYNAVQEATVLIGGERNLEFFSDFPGEKITLAGGMMKTLKALGERLSSDRLCIVASGDPLFYGVAPLVIKAFGKDNVEVIPHPSAMQLAFSRLGVGWAKVNIISLHGRALFGLVARIRHSQQVALFTDGDNTPAVIAQHLIRYNDGDFRATVLENLGGMDERVRSFSLSELAAMTGAEEFSPLNIVYLERLEQSQQVKAAKAQSPNMAEEQFAKKVPKLGLITKKEVRSLTLSALQLPPDGVFYDIGAGSGSVAIEASYLVPDGKVYTVECDEACQGFIEDNLLTHGVDNGVAIRGRAPEAISAIPDDADGIFIGGSRGSMVDIVKVCHDRLKPGGHLVINAVTMESVTSAQDALNALSDEARDSDGSSTETWAVTLVQISRGKPLAGKYHRYEALNPIHIFSYRKPLP